MSACGVPVTLKTKVTTAVGFLIQAHPHVAVVLLEDTQSTIRLKIEQFSSNALFFMNREASIYCIEHYSSEQK